MSTLPLVATDAKSRLGLLGAMVMYAWMMPSGSPPPSCFHVCPPSVDLKMPPPVPLNEPFSHGPSRLPTTSRTRYRDCVGSISTSLAADVLVLVEDLLEGLSAIGRAEDAAFGIRAVGMSGDRDEQPVRIVRIDGQRRNLLPVAQAKVGPGLARIG